MSNQNRTHNPTRWALLMAVLILLALTVSCREVKLPTAPPGADTPAASASATRERFVFYLPFVNDQASPIPSATATPSPEPATPVPAQAPPTPTPTPEWPEPLSQPGQSKLGIHVQVNNDPRIMAFIRVVKPRVVKGVDDLGFLAEVKQVSPQTVTIGRFSDVSQDMEGDPVEAARAFVAKFLSRYQSYSGIDYWEGMNEPVVRGRMQWYTTFEVERVRLMASYGLKCAIGSFSTGVPEWDEFEAFLPAIRAAQANGGILSLHEYDAPTMNRSIGVALPGRAPVSDRGPLTLRYRWWYEDILIPRGLAIPLVITELGVDGGVYDRPGPSGDGWLDFVDYWRSQGLDPDGVTEYLNQLSWYDNEMRRDSYVLGGVIFTAGSVSNMTSFEIRDLLRPLAYYHAAQP